MIVSRNLSLTLVAALALGAAACSDNSDKDKADTAVPDQTAADVAATTPPPADTAPATAIAGSAFLTDAMQGDNSEVQLGQLAAAHGSTKAIKDFGKMLADDHRKAGQEVAKLAQSLNVPTTASPTTDAETEIVKLNALSGAAFDKEFVSYTVDDHKKDIAKFEDEAKSSDPAAVKALASSTLPTLKKHLQAAQALR